jgi:hypothetical protein
MLMEILRLVTIVEDIMSEGGIKAERPIRRVAAAAVIKNPATGDKASLDQEQFFAIGKELGYILAKAAMAPLGDGTNVESYGKACIVGSEGVVEQGAMLIHKVMGVAVREIIGGGKAGIPGNQKVAPAGTSIDVPLSHRDNSGLATHWDTMPVMVPGAPNADEIVAILALSNGGRLLPWDGWNQ